MSARTIDVWFQNAGASTRVPVTAHDTPVPGLVVNEDPGPRKVWSVTHEASGAAVLVLPDPEAALYAAMRLAPLADWTQPGIVLRGSASLVRATQALADELCCWELTTETRAVSGENLAATETGGPS